MYPIRSIPYAALVFCLGCSLDASPILGPDGKPLYKIARDGGGPLHLVSVAGMGGGAAGHGVGRAGAGGTGGNAGDSSSDADAGDNGMPFPVDTMRLDASMPTIDASQQPKPDAAVDAGHDAGHDAGIPKPLLGKTCAPCVQGAGHEMDCAPHYTCASGYNTCFYQVTGGGSSSQCIHLPKLNANGALTDPICMPYDQPTATYTPCETWLQSNPNAGF